VALLRKENESGYHVASNEPVEMTEDDEMVQVAQMASKVTTTLGTPGWTDVLRPAIDARRSYYLENLLSRQERMEDIVFAQQSVLAIDELLSAIENIFAEGEQAKRYFDEKNG